jgi:PmbA protein
MIKEFFKIKINETFIKIADTKVESIRKKQIEENALRLYNDGFIGIAGKMGNYEEDELIKKAEKALNYKIPYDFKLTENENLSLKFGKDIISNDLLLEKTEEILEKFRTNIPQFTFSFGIKKINKIKYLKNDLKTELKSELNYYSLGFLIKDKNSSNIMDSFSGYDGFEDNFNKAYEITEKICKTHLKNIDIKNGTYPIIFFENEGLPKLKFYHDLHGMIFGSGGSIFSNKMNEKIFAENFTLYQSNNPQDNNFSHFFDSEGTFEKVGFRTALIENGILKSPYTDKKSSKLFNLPLTGSAGGEYDSVPSIIPCNFKIKNTHKSLKDILNGKKAILCHLASGGDFTSDGVFASPVQTAYLTDGESLLGKIPDINISSDIYKMYGKDYLGTCNNTLFDDNQTINVIKMKVEKL